jgi:REP element-mobilizing transposase RayT
MIRKPKTTGFWTGRLPHWEVEDGRYFITIHVAGAIPNAGRARLRALAEQIRNLGAAHPSEGLELQRSIFREMEHWLDRAEWNPVLSQSEVAGMIVESIRHRQKIGDWNLFEYVVMPTHLHLFGEIGSRGLKATIEDFKRWTGHAAAKILSRSEERFWQREWFDHWSRSDEEDDKIIQYIRENPVKAGLVANYLSWRYGSWTRL